MDEQSKQVKRDDGINRSDLPEVAHAQHSADEKHERRSKLLRNSFFFLIAYSCVHKLIVPLILKVLGTSRPEYAEVDFWFVPLLVLALSLFLSEAASLLTRVIMGAIIGHAVREIYLVSQGALTGWMVFSHLLSSVPIAGLSIFYLGRFQSLKKIALPWMAAIGVLLASFSLDFFVIKNIFNEKNALSSEGEPHDSSLAITTTQMDATKSKQTIKNCGNSGLQMRESEHGFRGNDFFEVQILECGLSPSVILLSDDEVLFRNLLSKTVNLHLLVKTADGERRNRNFVLSPNESKEIELELSEHGEAAMVYSDAYPELGLVGMLPKNFKGTWSFSRLPLKLERLP